MIFTIVVPVLRNVTAYVGPRLQKINILGSDLLFLRSLYFINIHALQRQNRNKRGQSARQALKPCERRVTQSYGCLVPTFNQAKITVSLSKLELFIETSRLQKERGGGGFGRPRSLRAAVAE